MRPCSGPLVRSLRARARGGPDPETCEGRTGNAGTTSQEPPGTAGQPVAIRIESIVTPRFATRAEASWTPNLVRVDQPRRGRRVWSSSCIRLGKLRTRGPELGEEHQRTRLFNAS